ncbi:MAG: molybdopterin molybdotransferase MoeA [Gammaproteobacteria bacterium]
MTDPCIRESTPLLSLAEALDRIHQAVVPVAGIERVSLKKAMGRILPEQVYSRVDIPHDDVSSMDGYAINSESIDTERTFELTCCGTSLAGRPYTETLRRGHCIRIFTGAVLPKGADTVIMQELVFREGDRVRFPAGLKPRSFTRQAGEDIVQGDGLFASPKRLTAADLGLLAAAGIHEIGVKRKPTVGYLSSGDELVGLGQPLNPGQIYDSNRYTLSGLLIDSAFDSVDLGVVGDDKAAFTKVLLDASSRFDAIITTGGASVGEADFVKEILDTIGRIDFWQIAVKPGKPFAFGRIGKAYFFGLPGNPVSVMVSFHQLVYPALRRLCGEIPPVPLRFQATCMTALKKSPGRQEFQRGILSQTEGGEFLVASAGGQGSHILSATSRANCYIVLPADCSGVEVDEKVEVEPFSRYL